MQKHLDNFIVYLENEKQMSQNTIESYIRDIKKLLKYIGFMGAESVSEITQAHLSGYISQMEKEQKAASTISRSIASIKSFFYFLMRERLIDENPSEKLEPPRVKKSMPEILTETDIEMLIEQPDSQTAKGKRDKAMLEVLYATGLRASEIVILKADDINLTLQYVKCRCKDKLRIIPIGNKAIRALEIYIKEAREMFVTNNDCEFLFVNCNGMRMTRQGFWKIIKEYAKKCSVDKKITPNAFRHSFAAHMVANGADLQAVQEMMGHSDISTTQIYVQMNKNHINEIYRKAHPRAK